MMDNIVKIKGFIEVLIPITQCNLRCHYCYVIQRDNRTNKKANLPEPEIIRTALRKERFVGGGNFYINLCGAGETMLIPNLAKITFELLKEGHYVNITTNGTVSKAFDEFEKLSLEYPELTSHLSFSFSLHHLEMLRTKTYEKFWNNIERCKAFGSSFLVQLNLCDEYEPYIETIKEECLKHVGALPQVAATREEENLTKDVRLYTKHSKKEYWEKGSLMKSPLFDYTMKNFMVKRKEFCYAGRLSYVLNLSTGIIKPCYCSYNYQNIYKDIEKPIRLYPVGRHCQSPFCMNSSHFMSLGVIPELRNEPTYVSLRNRKTVSGTEWYRPEFKAMASQKLYDNVDLSLSLKDKIHTEYYGAVNAVLRNVSQLIPKKTITWIKGIILKK